ncbi:single-stranded DNA-binding protein, partial [[Mycoplasma] collis]|uniref:single-stranded DNA-binding protein n=1 Tax=[Mycoplasma] collis TaxID=2127 RepID=UPI0012EB2A47
MNKLFLYGRIASDLELKQTKNNKNYLIFRFAVNNKKNDKTDFIPLIAWERNATFIKQWADKGSALLLECFLSINKYIDKTGALRSCINFNVQDVTLLETTETLNNRREKNKNKITTINQNS